MYSVSFGRSIIVLFSFHFQYFQKDLPELVESDPEQLFNLAFSMKINTKQMKKWEKEYAAVRKKEQEEMGELRVNINSAFITLLQPKLLFYYN